VIGHPTRADALSLQWHSGMQRRKRPFFMRRFFERGSAKICVICGFLKIIRCISTDPGASAAHSSWNTIQLENCSNLDQSDEAARICNTLSLVNTFLSAATRLHTPSRAALYLIGTFIA